MCRTYVFVHCLSLLTWRKCRSCAAQRRTKESFTAKQDNDIKGCDFQNPGKSSTSCNHSFPNNLLHSLYKRSKDTLSVLFLLRGLENLIIQISLPSKYSLPPSSSRNPVTFDLCRLILSFSQTESFPSPNIQSHLLLSTTNK